MWLDSQSLWLDDWSLWQEGRSLGLNNQFVAMTVSVWSRTVSLLAAHLVSRAGEPVLWLDIRSLGPDGLVVIGLNLVSLHSDCNLEKLRAYEFRNNRSTMLKLLPPTEHRFLLHLQHDTLATITDKTAHVAKPQLSTFVDYGWALENGKLVPVP